jgi:hypothetical protein
VKESYPITFAGQAFSEKLKNVKAGSQNMRSASDLLQNLHDFAMEVLKSKSPELQIRELASYVVTNCSAAKEKLEKIRSPNQRALADDAVRHTFIAAEHASRIYQVAVRKEVNAGTQHIDNTKKGHAARMKEAAAEHRQWQAAAENIWRKKPHLSRRAVAMIIDKARADYVRQFIRKKVE